MNQGYCIPDLFRCFTINQVAQESSDPPLRISLRWLCCLAATTLLQFKLLTLQFHGLFVVNWHHARLCSSETSTHCIQNRYTFQCDQVLWSPAWHYTTLPRLHTILLSTLELLFKILFTLLTVGNYRSHRCESITYWKYSLNSFYIHNINRLNHQWTSTHTNKHTAHIHTLLATHLPYTTPILSNTQNCVTATSTQTT